MDQGSPTTVCPPPAELAEFIAGNLTGPAFQRIARHVESCRLCETALGTLDEPETPFLSRLRQATMVAAPADHPVPPELLSAAESLYSDAPHPPIVGLRRLGKFDLLEELGRGSFGQVFRARDSDLGRIVAIKLLRAGRLASREEVDRFVREARSAAQLKHPGLVAIYETAQTDEGIFYIVEEFVQGQTLAERLGVTRFDYHRAAEMLANTADALDYAHQHGVIHRDVKPSNIMLDPDDRPHLMDFGLAKREVDETPMTLEGQFLGTPAYVSPEQARGDSRHVDGRTDVYSMGVILYELLTGERPFRGNRQMLLLQVLNDEPRSPRQLNDKAPRDLETICLKAMAKSPTRRYATAAELADDLRRYLRGEPIKARPIGRMEQLWRWCRRNPVAAGLLLAISLSSAFGMWELSRLSRDLVERSALESAAQQSQILDEINKFYTADVVERAKKVDVTHDYMSRPNAIPLPATLTIQLARLISERNKEGVQVRLYSDYPFKTRKDGHPKDDFERDALEQLEKKPGEPYYRFEDFQGRPSLRYATPQVMKDACVQCHNKHNDSIKTNWVEGEVGGVLEIIRPLDGDVTRARDGLRRTLIVMAVISGSLLGLTLLILIVGNRQPRGVGRKVG